VSCFRRRSEEASWLTVLGVVIVLLSYPFYFLLERGNLHGLVLALMMLALWLSGRRQVLAGLCAGLAIATKLYAILLLTPLIVERRWKLLGVAAAVFVTCVAATPTLWLGFLARAIQQEGSFGLQGNGSIVCTFHFFGMGLRAVGLPLQEGTLRGMAVGAYVAMFLFSSYADYLKRERRDDKEAAALALLYFPFMVAMPQQAYHDGLVVLLALVPAVCYLWGRRAGRRSSAALLVITGGIALSQMQAVALSRVAGGIAPHVIPGLGLLLAMAGVTWYKVRC
jgi:hypothetical protein